MEKKWTRRAVTLSFVGTGCAVCGYLAAHGNLQALTAIITWSGMAGAYYLGAKTGAAKPQS